MKKQEFQYRILDSPDQRQWLFERGNELIDYVKNEGHETLVFLDRSARPASWLFKALWQNHLPYHQKPNILFLNVGQKNLRKQYMEGIGLSYAEPGTGSEFVGIYDYEENIALFRQRVRSDERTRQQISTELGKYWRERIVGKKVLIVDECEHEGVSRLFTEEVIREIFSPKSIDYFEFDIAGLDMYHGLSEEKFNPSFVAKPSKDTQAISDARTLRKEFSYLATERPV